MSKPTLALPTITPQQAAWDATINTAVEDLRAWLEDAPVPFYEEAAGSGSLPAPSSFDRSIAFAVDAVTSEWRLYLSDGTIWDAVVTEAGEQTMSSKTLIAPNFTKRITKRTTNLTVNASTTGAMNTNTGAAGTITMALPAATVGLTFEFYVGAAFELRIDPDGTETIALPSTGVQGGAGKYLVSSTVGSYVRLICETAGSWIATPFTGTWTAEP